MNGNPLGNIRIGVSVNSAGFTDSLESMKRQMKSMTKEMKMQLSAYDKNDKSLEALENRHQSYSRAAEIAGKNVDKLKERYERLSEQFGENSKQAQKAADELNTATAQYNGYARQLQAVEADLEEVTSGTKKLKDNMSLLSQETKAQVALLRSSGREAQALQANINGLNAEVNERNQLIDKEKQKLQQLKQQYGANSDEVRRQILVIQQLETANNEAKNAMSRMNAELSEMGGSNKLVQMLSNVQEKAKQLSKTLATTLTPAIAGIGVAASKVATDADDAFTKMQNSMGLTEEQTEALKQKARSIYKDGYGESMSEVTEAITEAKTNMSELNDVDLTYAAKSAMNLGKTYDADINEVTRGANSLMANFGMTTKDTFDLLAKAAQNGGNKSRELFDNLAEYGVNFEGAGFSAQEMFNILTNGLKKGYNMDRLNDTILEFKLSAEDGGKAYDEAMASLGDDSAIAQAYKSFEQGKITVADYYKVVQDNLGKIKKEMTTQEYENFGKVLFGTKIEDQGSKVVESMKTVNAEMENTNGTMEKFNKNAEESFGQRFQSLINTTKDSLQPLGTSILNIAEQYLPPLIAALTNAAQWFEGLSGSGQKLVIAVGAIGMALPAIGMALSAILTPLKLVFSGFSKLIGFFTTGASGISRFSSILSVLRNSFTLLRTGIMLAFNSLKAFLGPVGLVITGLQLLWMGLKYAYNHSESFRNIVDKLKNTLINVWNKMKSFKITATVSKMWTSVKNFFVNGYNTVKSKMLALGSSIANVWNSIKTKSVSIVTNLWKSVKNFFTSGYNAVKSKMTSVKTTMSDIWDKIKKNTVDKVTSMIDHVKKMPQRMADKIAAGASALKNGGKKMLNGLISGVQWGINKVIAGANKVLGFFGSDKKISKVDLAKYAKGTPRGGHKGGLAMVNDAKGSKYRELVSLPNGQSFVPEGRNVVMNLPKGSSVLRGEKTHEAMKKGMIPRYKTGVGFLDKAFEWGKDKFDKVKDWTSDIWEIATSPDAMKKVLAKFVNATLPENLTKGILPSAIGGLTNKMMDAAKNFLFNEKEAMEVAQGEFHWDGKLEKDPNKVGAGSGPQGLMSYVYEIFKNNLLGKFKIKGFGGFSDRNMVGGSSKSMHAYGRAIDIFTASNQPDAEKKKIAEASRRLPLLQYAIYNKKWTKPGAGWSNYMRPGRNPHTDHVHIDFKAPTKANLKSLGGGGTGSTAGVQQWKTIATKALKMTGDYSEANLNALLRRMQQESTGNPRAINLWDSNAKKGTPSKGLMQVIDPTFKAYARKGYNKNIYDPLSNILASINYTKKRYGSLQAGWGRIGGYANGGIITKHQIAQIGEGNKPEAVIPLSKGKRSRALDLLGTAVGIMGGETKVDGNNNFNALLNTMVQQNEQIAKLTNIVTAILAKDNNVYLDSKEITSAVNKNNNITDSRARKLSGGYV